MSYFRFRKTFSILPGVRVNLSKTGVSGSLGGHGATLNVGHGKENVTLGVPGTGLSYRTPATHRPDPGRGRRRCGGRHRLAGGARSRPLHAALVAAALVLSRRGLISSRQSYRSKGRKIAPKHARTLGMRQLKATGVLFRVKTLSNRTGGRYRRRSCARRHDAGGSADAFRAFVDGLWPEAQALGVSRATFDAAFKGLTPDLTLPDLVIEGRKRDDSAGQAEFTKSAMEYLNPKYLADLAVQGRTFLKQHEREIVNIEKNDRRRPLHPRRHLGPRDRLRHPQGHRATPSRCWRRRPTPVAARTISASSCLPL